MPAPSNEAIRPVEATQRAADELVVLLVRTAKALVDRSRAARPAGARSPMTVVHGLAARYLVGRNDVTAGELARHLGITKQSTSEVVAALERAGTVRRAPHPSDGRARVVLLTDEGAATLEDGPGVLFVRLGERRGFAARDPLGRVDVAGVATGAGPRPVSPLWFVQSPRSLSLLRSTAPRR